MLLLLLATLKESKGNFVQVLFLFLFSQFFFAVSFMHHEHLENLYSNWSHSIPHLFLILDCIEVCAVSTIISSLVISGVELAEVYSLATNPLENSIF